MKSYILVLIPSLLVGCAQQSPAPDLSDNLSRASYAVGMTVGQQLASQFDESGVDPAVFLRGLRDTLENPDGPQLLNQEAAQAAIAAYQQNMIERKEAELLAEIEANKDEGEAYLQENARREGVVTLESGLQYERLSGEPGGRSPTLEDTVLAHYHGTLVDGTVFDSTRDREEPAAVPLRVVVPGWQEALQMMSEGEKWRIVVPPALAYGEEGASGKILPHSTLVFEIELVAVQPRG